MGDPISTVLEAADRIRRSSGYRGLASDERAQLDQDLGRIEQAVRTRAVPGAARHAVSDPFAVPLETPNDLIGFDPRRAQAAEPPGPTGYPSPSTGAPAAVPPSAPARTGTDLVGERARRALDAVDFPSFVAGLIQGTFQAIVDATAQQVREYAKLVASLSQSVDEFTRDNVSPNQVRDWLGQKFPKDLVLALPSPGERASPRLIPRQGGDGSPEWLAQFGLQGETLTPELVEGALLEAGTHALGEERMRLLANMVLLGINRIVVDDGQLKARLQFHAEAREQLNAEAVGQTGATQIGIAGRQAGMASQVSTLVSTVNMNAQANASIKADLVGEVSVRFRTETFDLRRFADAQAIALINRHTVAAAPEAGSSTGPDVGGTPADMSPGARP